MNNIDLTKGDITKNIFLFTTPILATSFINMTYSFIDMICIGKLGSGAVAAVGTSGFFLWFANSSASMCKIGSQVFVSQAFGEKNFISLRRYAQSSFVFNFILGLVIGIILILFNNFFINFFRLGEEKIITYARQYLIILAMSMPFIYSNHILSAIFNSVGNSKIPFLANTFGLIFNIIFDIVLIFGFGIFPRLEVTGAAIATSLAQVAVFLILIYNNSKLDENLKINFFENISFHHLKEILKIGFPPAIQSTLYCIYSIILARIISYFGPIPIAVQKIGSQIESISWMTTDGLAIASTAFVGQNLGANKNNRILKGIKTLTTISFLFGFIATLLLIFCGDFIFSIFLKDNLSIKSGVDYLRILGYSQIFMCFEILYIGIFNGFGKTKFPAIISIIFTGLRIPFAIVLSRFMGVNGIWWAISISSIIKGILITFTFYSKYYKELLKDKL